MATFDASLTKIDIDELVRDNKWIYGTGLALPITEVVRRN